MTSELNIHQPIQFGPHVDTTKISGSIMRNLQEMLDELGDAPTGVITLNGFFARYNEDGGLLIDLFLRNGLTEAIQDFRGRVQVITADRNVIAVDDFQFSFSEFGELEPGCSRPWTLFFDRRCVMRRLEPIGTYTLDARMYFQKESLFH